MYVGSSAAVGTEPALSGAISESGITVQVENLSADARLVIAQYHYGQMVDVVTKNISCDGSYTIAAQKLVKGDEFKLFLSDKESSAPLCKAVLPVQTEDLLITESAMVNEGSYRNVTIAASVGDGDVTFNNVTIYGDLLVEGGGSNTVSMSGCHVHGKVNINKTSGKPPRLHLSNTDLPKVEANQPAIIEAADNNSSVGELTASSDVTIQGAATKVETVTVSDTSTTPTVTVAEGAKIETVAVSPNANANVTVEAGASVIAVEAKGETTIHAAGTVSSVTATASVNVSSGAVERVEIPEDADSTVSITVSENAAVTDVTVNSTKDVTITAAKENSVGSVSTDKASAEGLGKVTVVGNGAGSNGNQVNSHNWPNTWTYVDATSHKRVCQGHPNHPHTQIDVHSWNSGVVTKQPSCSEAGEMEYTCTVCGGTKTVSIAPTTHTVVSIPGKKPGCTESGLTAGNYCSVCGKTLVAQEVVPAIGKHSYTDGNDFDCNVCGSFRDIDYTKVFVRTFHREGYESDQLRIVNGEPVFNDISFSAEDDAKHLMNGWSYGDGWNVLVEDSANTVKSSKPYASMNAELKKTILNAVKVGDFIYLDLTVGAEGLGKNGFDITFDISSGDLAYTLAVPEGAEDIYHVEFYSFDHMGAYSGNVSKNDAIPYGSIIWAPRMDRNLSGYFGAVSIIREIDDDPNRDSEIVASWKMHDAFYAETSSGDITDNVVVTINTARSTGSSICYEISGLTGKCNYQLFAEDARGYHSTFALGAADADGKCYLYSEKLTDKVKLSNGYYAEPILPQKAAVDVQEGYNRLLIDDLTELPYLVAEGYDFYFYGANIYCFRNKTECEKLISGAEGAVLSPDGERIYYIRGEELRSVAVDSSMDTLSIAEDVETFFVTENGKYIYYINDDDELTQIAQNAAVSLFGEDALGDLPMMMGSEDFSYFADKVPSVFGFVGSRNEAAGLTASNHNDRYSVDESCLHRGAAMYAQFAADFLEANA